MFDGFLQSMGNAFTPEMYLFWTRIECSAWTLSDVVIVLYLIRLANYARKVLNRDPHVFSYLILAATIPLAAFIPLAPTGGIILLIELAVTIPHFLLILYVLTKDGRTFAAALHALTRQR
ncbi:MAG: hypothetical protein NTZ09_09085 [Candidatus Hydrogenedentes bacterium]|nr:hypothetical protein [Candidatus Hydrogenedentota bacterium]